MSENFFVGRPYFFLIHTWNLTPCRSIPTSRNPVLHPPPYSKSTARVLPPHMSCGAIVRIVWHMTQFSTPYAVRCSRSGRMPCGAIIRAAWKTKQANPCGAARVIPDARGGSLCVFRNKKQHLPFRASAVLSVLKYLPLRTAAAPASAGTLMRRRCTAVRFRAQARSSFRRPGGRAVRRNRVRPSRPCV